MVEDLPFGYLWGCYFSTGRLAHFHLDICGWYSSDALWDLLLDVYLSRELIIMTLIAY